jgi:hypothetical protein
MSWVQTMNPNLDILRFCDLVVKADGCNSQTSQNVLWLVDLPQQSYNKASSGRRQGVVSTYQSTVSKP